jgi:hypothetical protein
MDPESVKDSLAGLDKTALYVHLDKTLFSEPSDEFHFATPEQLSKPVNLLK